MINFKSIKNKLKYKPLYKEIDLNDGYKPIKIIINPSEKMKNEIIEIITNNIKNNIKENQILDLNNKDIFIPITKLLTDIRFENIEEEMMFMKFLFENPSQEGIELRDSIIDIIQKIIKNFTKEIDMLLNNINPEELKEIMETNKL